MVAVEIKRKQIYYWKKNIRGESPLLLACIITYKYPSYLNKNIIPTLLTCGADKYIKDNIGKSIYNYLGYSKSSDFEEKAEDINCDKNFQKKYIQ